MDESTHVSVSIERPWREVYDFAANPANLPQWAAGLAEAPVEQVNGDWISESPMGRVTIAFAPPNDWGVLDHEVTLPTGETAANPLRVFPNGDGCDVVFTVRRRAGMSDADAERDTAAVAEDLAALRALMEL